MGMEESVARGLEGTSVGPRDDGSAYKTTVNNVSPSNAGGLREGGRGGALDNAEGPGCGIAGDNGKLKRKTWALSMDIVQKPGRIVPPLWYTGHLGTALV